MTATVQAYTTSFILLALTALGRAVAQGTPGGAPTVGTTPEAVFKTLGCWVVKVLSSPVLVAVAGGVLLLVFGWGKIFGEMNAFQSFKNGIIGVVIVLVSAGVSTTLFGAGCA